MVVSNMSFDEPEPGRRKWVLNHGGRGLEVIMNCKADVLAVSEPCAQT